MFREYEARKKVNISLGRFQERVPTRILILGTGISSGASDIIVPGGRDRVWAREKDTPGARYFPILNVGRVNPMAGLRVMVGYDPISQYPNEEQVLGIYQTEPIGISARVTNTGALSAANDNWRLLSFTGARWDGASMFNSGAAFSSRLTANAPGTYIMGAQIAWAPNGTGIRALALRRNSAQSYTSGSQLAAMVHTTIAASAMNCSQTLVTSSRLDIGDYIEAFVRQSSGGTLNVNSLDEYSPDMWLTKIEQNLVL